MDPNDLVHLIRKMENFFRERGISDYFIRNYENRKYTNSVGKKCRNNNGFTKNKYDIPEINELKKNRYFNRTKTNFRNTIVARDISNRKNESKVDQLIDKLKKHYS